MGLERHEAPVAAAAPVRRREWSTLLGLVALSLVLYANNLGNGLVYDDNPALVANPAAHGLGQTATIFTTASWWPPNEAAHHYRPIPTWTYAAQYSLHDLRPAGYHLVNDLLHGVIGWLVFLVLVGSGLNRLTALLAAALFVAHPVHTEPVDWVIGRADVLCAGFLLLSLLAHIGRVRGGGWGWSLVAVVSFVLSAWSKETGILTPLVLLAWDLTLAPDGENEGGPIRRLVHRLRHGGWIEYVIYAVIVVLLLFQRRLLVGGATTATVTPMASPLVGATFGERLLTGSYVLARYLWQLIWPARLSVDWSPNELTKLSSLADPRAWQGLAVLGGYLAATWVAVRRWPLMGFVLLMSAVVMLPSANILFPIGTIMAERLVYLPVLLVVVPLAAAVWRCPRATAALALAGVLLLGYGARTMVRNRDWRDDRSLFESAWRTCPRSAMANKNLAATFNDLGRQAEAEPLARAAVAMVPQFPDAWLALGNSLFGQGRTAEAAEAFARCVALVPGHAPAHANLGACDHILKRYTESLKEDALAAELAPNLPLPWYNRVHTLVELGRLDAAEQALREAVTRFPDAPNRAAAERKLQSAELARFSRPGA